jgi:rhodanese-related sulfurtransferase
MLNMLHPPIKTLTQEQIKIKLKRKDPIEFVSVLGAEETFTGLIRGSKKIPLEQLDKRLQEIDKNKEVITYCTGYGCDASRKAAERLASRGFKVRAYEGGIKEWKDANLPTE